MSKFGKAIVVMVIVGIVYLLMLVTVPVISGLISTANTTAAASVNITNLPGSTSFLLSIPWILWFVPAVIGLVAVIIILRARTG